MGLMHATAGIPPAVRAAVRRALHAAFGHTAEAVRQLRGEAGAALFWPTS
jgi:hypothetical protein